MNLKLSLPQAPTTFFPSCFIPIATASTTVTFSTSNTVTASDLEKINVLGCGSSGTVYKVSHKTTSETYALKKIKEDMDSTSRHQFLREIKILRLVDSPYVVKCQDIYEKHSGEVSILMEYNMDLGTLESLRGNVVKENLASWSSGKGTLAEVPAMTSSSPGHSGFNMVSVWLPGPSSPVPVGRCGIVGLSERSGYLDYQKKKKNVVKEDQLALIARQVLKGLSYLHGLKIVHRDIKPANILRSSREEVKIADFGVSKIMVKSLDKSNTFTGTCAYMSPQRFDSEAADVSEEDKANVYAGDIWSFGLTMLEILVGHFPHGEKLDWATLMCAVCFGESPKAPEECSDELKSFIDCCLRKKLSERWTASQLLSHPFLLQQD